MNKLSSSISYGNLLLSMSCMSNRDYRRGIISTDKGLNIKKPLLASHGRSYGSISNRFVLHVSILLISITLTGCPKVTDDFLNPAGGEGDYGYTCNIRSHGSVVGTWSKYFKTREERDRAAADHTQTWGPAHTTQPIDNR